MSPLLQPDPGTVIWTLITFVVVLVLLRSTVWRPLLTALDEREARIRDALDGADQARAESEAVLAEYRARLEQVEQEAEQIREEARRTAEQVREDMVERARNQARQIIQEARRSTDAERRAAAVELRREVADIAVQAAGALLDVNLDNARNRQFVDGMIEQFPAASESRR